MEYIKTSLDEDGSGLISSHYIEEVLPQTKQFKEFHCNRLTDWVDGVGQKPLKDVFAESRELNERQTEDVLIRPILESLDNKLLAQVGLDGDIMDFVVYDGDEVRPLQRQVAFLYNVKLAKWLLPDKMDIVNAGYEKLVEGIDTDKDYVKKILAGDPEIPESVPALKDIDNEIRNDYRPLHWRIAFPHIAVRGGFDFVISNPPWDLVKGDHNEFFSDYIDGYSEMETAEAKRMSKELMAKDERVQELWNEYNQNIDAGCTGLRKLLLEKVSIRELVMFENRKRLFEIHGQYKFDVITFEKTKPRKNLAFKAGFYWYDPIWLDGEPDEDYIAKNEHNKRALHRTYSYPTEFIKEADSDRYTIYEFRNKKQIDVFKKMLEYPAIGDESKRPYIRTYTEFNMTSDSDLFNTNGTGWSLYQGEMVHHYNAHLKEPERFVIQSDGESRLATRWKSDIRELTYEEYQSVLDSFPLVDADQKKRCLNAFNDWTFEL